MLFFVVGVTLSHYWDVVQRRRSTTVPLCGLDGPFRYQLLVITGKLPGAGQEFAPFVHAVRAFVHPSACSFIQSTPVCIVWN